MIVIGPKNRILTTPIHITVGRFLVHFMVEIVLALCYKWYSEKGRS